MQLDLQVNSEVYEMTKSTVRKQFYIFRCYFVGCLVYVLLVESPLVMALCNEPGIILASEAPVGEPKQTVGLH